MLIKRQVIEKARNKVISEEIDTAEQYEENSPVVKKWLTQWIVDIENKVGLILEYGSTVVNFRYEIVEEIISHRKVVEMKYICMKANFCQQLDCPHKIEHEAIHYNTVKNCTMTEFCPVGGLVKCDEVKDKDKRVIDGDNIEFFE